MYTNYGKQAEGAGPVVCFILSWVTEIQEVQIENSKSNKKKNNGMLLLSTIYMVKYYTL